MDVNAGIKLDVGMNELVDKLAEKMGLAADQVSPVLKDAVDQYQAGAMAAVFYGLALLLILCVAGWLLLRWGRGVIKAVDERRVYEVVVYDQDGKPVEKKVRTGVDTDPMEGAAIFACVMGVISIATGLLSGTLVVGYNIVKVFAPGPYMIKWMLGGGC